MEQDSRITTLINQAWENAFVSGPNYFPDILKKTDGTPVKSIGGVKGDMISLCMSGYSGGEYSMEPANLDFSSMKLSGLGNATSGGAPIYSDNNTIVKLPINISSFTVVGRVDIKQTCCIARLLFWCISKSLRHRSEPFTLKANSSEIIITCSISPDNEIIVTNTSIKIGPVSVNFGSSPEWVKWLNTIYELGIGDSIKNEIHNMVSSEHLKKQLQAAMHNLLQAG